MKRREFITLLAGAPAALPWRSTYAQKSSRAAAEAASKVYKVGILNAAAPNAAGWRSRTALCESSPDWAFQLVATL